MITDWCIMQYSQIGKVVALSLGMSIISLAQAQESQESKKGLFETIEVTATKRSESIQEVPVSVSALSGEQLDALGLSDTTEILNKFQIFK